jgi:hypothetical protein
VGTQPKLAFAETLDESSDIFDDSDEKRLFSSRTRAWLSTRTRILDGMRHGRVTAR